MEAIIQAALGAAVVGAIVGGLYGLFFGILGKLFKKKNHNVVSIKKDKSENSTKNQVGLSNVINARSSGQDTQNFTLSNINEDDFYEKAWDEIETNNLIKSIWSRAISECDGDNDKAKSLYIKLRVGHLKEEYSKKQYENHLKKIEIERQKELELIERKFIDGEGINDFDDNGKSPLIMAIDKGDLEIVELLLNLGANPNVEYYGNSLKSYVRQKNLNEILQLLQKYS